MPRPVIDTDALEERAIYWIKSRNLRFAVWNGREFTGRRFKFNSVLIDSEVPNTEDRLGTVVSARRVARLRDDIPLESYLGSVCASCGGKAWWTGPPSPAPWACEGGCEDVRSYAVTNKEIMGALEALEEGRADERYSLDPKARVLWDNHTDPTEEQRAAVEKLVDGRKLAVIWQVLKDEKPWPLYALMVPGPPATIYGDGRVEELFPETK